MRFHVNKSKIVYRAACVDPTGLKSGRRSAPGTIVEHLVEYFTSAWPPHLARLTAGSRGHLSKKQQLRTIVLSTTVAAGRSSFPAGNEVDWRSNPWSTPLSAIVWELCTASRVWVVVYLWAVCCESPSDSARPASTSRTSVAAAATSFNAGGGELARSSRHLPVAKYLKTFDQVTPRKVRVIVAPFHIIPSKMAGDRLRVRTLQINCPSLRFADIFVYIVKILGFRSSTRSAK